MKVEREDYYGGRRFGRFRSFWGAFWFLVTNRSVVLLGIQPRGENKVAMQVRYRGLQQGALFPILKQFVEYLEGGQSNLNEVKNILGYDPTEGRK